MSYHFMVQAYALFRGGLDSRALTQDMGPVSEIFLQVNGGDATEVNSALSSVCFSHIFLLAQFLPRRH